MSPKFVFSHFDFVGAGPSNSQDLPLGVSLKTANSMETSSIGKKNLPENMQRYKICMGRASPCTVQNIDPEFAYFAPKIHQDVDLSDSGGSGKGQGSPCRFAIASSFLHLECLC